jgi:hypothetical protein
MRIDMEAAMPYVFVPPELVADHKGVPIYRAYKNEDANEPLAFWFALYPFGVENDAARITFDARTLKAWPRDRKESEVDVGAVLAAAVEAGEIRGGVENALQPYVRALPSEGLSLLSN